MFAAYEKELVGCDARETQRKTVLEGFIYLQFKSVLSTLS